MKPISSVLPKLRADELEPEVDKKASLNNGGNYSIPAFCTAFDCRGGCSELDSDLQKESPGNMSTTSQSASDGGRMAFWSENVDAAEAKKADGASICALMTSSPPFRIERDARIH